MSKTNVCLIAGSPLSVAPYVKRYMKVLEGNGINYDVIYKDSVGQMQEDNSNCYVYYFKPVKSPLGKVLRFDAYRRFIKKILKKNKYSKIVVFTAESAILAYQILKSISDKTEYIIDLRDYSVFLDIPFLKSIFWKALYGAEFVVLSSHGFKKWLPEDVRYYIMHNMPIFSVPVKNTLPNFESSVCIGYLGGIGYLESNIAIAQDIRNSSKFSLLYAGTYPNGYNIRTYCEENGIENVVFYGKYDEAEKRTIYKKVDLINAVYANDSLTVTTALPNKLYDSAFYKIPIMVCSGTYLAETVRKYGLGFDIDPKKDNIKQKIEEYVRFFDEKKFILGCERLIKDSSRELSEAEGAIVNFLMSK